VDYVVETQRLHEEFRYPQDWIAKKDDPYDDDEIKGTPAVLKLLKKGIVDWCGDEYQFRFARKVYPPAAGGGERRAAAAQAEPAAAGGAAVLPDLERMETELPARGAGKAAEDRMQTDKAEFAEGEGPMDFDVAGTAQPDPVSPDSQQGGGFSPTGGTGEIAYDDWQADELMQQGSPVQSVGGTLAGGDPMDPEEHATTHLENLVAWLPVIETNAMGKETLALPPQVTGGSGFAGGGRAPPNRVPAARQKGRLAGKKTAGGGEKWAPTLNGGRTLGISGRPGLQSADFAWLNAVLDGVKTLAKGGVKGGRQLADPHLILPHALFWPTMSLDDINKVFKRDSRKSTPIVFEAEPKRMGAEGYIAYSIDNKFAVKIQKWSKRVDDALRKAAEIYEVGAAGSCSIARFRAFECPNDGTKYVATLMEKMKADAKKAFGKKEVPPKFTEQVMKLRECLVDHGATYPDMKPANIGVTANGSMRLIDIDGIDGNVASFPAIAHWHNSYDDAVDRDGRRVTKKSQKFAQTTYAFELTIRWLQLPTRAKKQELEEMFGWKSFRRGPGYKTYGERLEYLKTTLKFGFGVQGILERAEELRTFNEWPEFIE
jgi:hypothetical protein